MNKKHTNDIPSDVPKNELFDSVQMLEHAHKLGKSHTIRKTIVKNHILLQRLKNNEQYLDEVHTALIHSISDTRKLDPAAGWLIDNYYLIQDQIQICKKDFPQQYSLRLPQLANSSPTGIPRVYDIAYQRISHSDGLIDTDTLTGFIKSYQTHNTLTLGELWAMPIMFRFALIERIRYLSVGIINNLKEQISAESWSSLMINRTHMDNRELIPIIDDITHSVNPLKSSFITKIAKLIKEHGVSLSLPLIWIEQLLSDRGKSIDMIIDEEMKSQASEHVSLSNCIRSLRSLSFKDWKEFVENTSKVEKKLRQDPSGIYTKMDFATRDSYRHVIEEIAIRGKQTEENIAACAIQLANEHVMHGSKSDKKAHVGYYLRDRGYTLLKKIIPFKPLLRKKYNITGTEANISPYVLSVLIIAMVITVTINISLLNNVSRMNSIIMTILLFICATGLSVHLVNRLSSFQNPPRTLPRMNFNSGIPVASRTLVIIPSMLTSIDHVDSLAKDLEIRFLGNRDDNIFFGLLTDFADSTESSMPDDSEILTHTITLLSALNSKYQQANSINPFFLFHRARLWNSTEQSWIGYERKRGKLSALNDLLRGKGTDKFELVLGRLDILQSVRYVITLDTDTQLPRDTARNMIETMAHPLNRPTYDIEKKRVTEGYGIIQPRISVNVNGKTSSIFSHLISNEEGIDPYTHAISNVYQDLFGEGSFIGKGIYDVDTFILTLKNQFPENLILSHDLLEGCYARSAVASNIQLFEEAPSTYIEDITRRKRWTRGDWQLIHWLSSHTATLFDTRKLNTISFLSRWKILDNLRRSLDPIAITLLLIISLFVFPDSAFFFIVILTINIAPSTLITYSGFRNKPKETHTKTFIKVAIRNSGKQLTLAFFRIMVLPYEAIISTSTILRTLGRIFFTHRHLLEWIPSSHRTIVKNSFYGSLKQMWFIPVSAITTVILLYVLNISALVYAFPLLLLWSISPLFVWLSGITIHGKGDSLAKIQLDFLHKTARKTWAYFETYVTAEDNWLPPDNYQELPVSKIAHRTSPTNIGLSLLSCQAAYDFGYISTGRYLDRTENTLHTLDSLEKYRKHLFNWYDTENLKPLVPRYVSTVDSGNLSACLMVLSVALQETLTKPVINGRLWEGIQSSYNVLLDIISPDIPACFIDFQKKLNVAKNLLIPTIGTAKEMLCQLCKLLDSMNKDSPDTDDSAACWWISSLHTQCLDAIHDITLFFPWIDRTELYYNIPDVMMPDIACTLSDILIISERLEKTDTKTNTELIALIKEGRVYATLIKSRLVKLIKLTDDLSVMDFTFLYNKKRHLFSIGYSLETLRKDASHYDLLASESRLTSFIAIAQGQIPQDNWFSLGRLLLISDGTPILASWTGSMFEYLMPRLLMPEYKNSLLSQTCTGAVNTHIQYGIKNGIPWGISESGYNAFDNNDNYQYRAFGVPSLGLKHVLPGNIVVSPYASALALMVAPEKACSNLQKLSTEGVEGAYGFYEAIEYSATHLPQKQTHTIIRSFMAHHMGMTILSIGSLLLDNVTQNRFESLSIVRATLLILDERLPKATIQHIAVSPKTDLRLPEQNITWHARILENYNTPEPELQLLSNGHYSIMKTNAGGGYSTWNNVAITRWHEDTTRDNWGLFLYIKDCKTSEFWSNTFQPTLKKSESYNTVLAEGRVEFRRQDHGFVTYTEIVVSPEDDIELHRIRITNRSRFKRSIEVTSYAEAVLDNRKNDSAHPSFNNLFMESEIIPSKNAIVFVRRKRSPEETNPVLIHLMVVRDGKVIDTSYETDRLHFIGRGNSPITPDAMTCTDKLSGNHGSVLDPIISIRHKLIIDGESTILIDMITGVSNTRDSAMKLIEKYNSKRFANRTFELAQTHSQILLQQLKCTEYDAALYNKMAAAILYSNHALRTTEGRISENTRGQSGLWGYSLSGDLPIVLLIMNNTDNILLVQQVINAHTYWSKKGLDVDVMILNEEHGIYLQPFQESIHMIIESINNSHSKGHIYVRSTNQISEEDRNLIHAAARIVLMDTKGSLEEQLQAKQTTKDKKKVQYQQYIKAPLIKSYQPETDIYPDLSKIQFWNGVGGFSRKGNEYIIISKNTLGTPMPWSNVLANPRFGCIVTERGMSYSWSENSHEYRLTPWHNDPISDNSGEAIYIRDDESGEFWSPTPLPCHSGQPFTIRHGFGYTIYSHEKKGIESVLRVFVAKEDPVQFMQLTLSNESHRTRKLSITSYTELVLGERRDKTIMHIITEIDPKTGAVFARNTFNSNFPDRTVFLDCTHVQQYRTGDRTEFLGRNSSMENPEALHYRSLSGEFGAKKDPCIASQSQLVLLAGETKQITYIFGCGKSRTEAVSLIQKFRKPESITDELNIVTTYWDQTTTSMQISTPDTGLNILANGWLMYQVLSSRLWGRSGFYQSGGAYGFRDQLQDSMSIISNEPGMAREHILLCASRQFIEGDVQHWWHPPNGSGSRTHCSDDYLWLPLAVSRYIKMSGDFDILTEIVPYLEGRILDTTEDSYYEKPSVSETRETLNEHCMRAIRRGCRYGKHGLPLMGSGDWNDGMNMVGHKGIGESVWLGFFLFKVLTDYRKTAQKHGNHDFSHFCEEQAASLQKNLEANAWDGQWYLRAWFDDGTPLGSSTNTECIIDSISQSWSVLSEAANMEHTRRAMDSVEKHLLVTQQKLVKLLSPPFNGREQNPGYIRGYVPGVRENGGQYTHAAVWAAMAFSKLGENNKAWEVFTTINPVNHTDTWDKVSVYKTEPYVLAADVYSAYPHSGRGGWTWYTGSAGWMLQFITEYLLGIIREENTLRFRPGVPTAWEGYTLSYRYYSTTYRIAVSFTNDQTKRNDSEQTITMDGIRCTTNYITLVDDSTNHTIDVLIYRRTSP